eukprot:scaffold15960_cov19-Tisochrysis_lutea.AAC.3
MACIRTTSKTQSAFNIWGLSSLRQGSSTFNTCPKAPNKRKRSAKLNRTRHINLHWLNLQRLCILHCSPSRRGSPSASLSAALL